jgi:glucose-6-phosphate dehydrogenase assembly protein OpcA
MVAQFFDTPNQRPYLDRISRVTIDIALSQRGGVNRAQGLFLAGWLASRLDWEPVEPTYELVRSEKGEDLPPSARLSMKSGKRAITVLINTGPSKSDYVPGEIDGINLEVLGEDGKDVEATFSVSDTDKQDQGIWIRTEIKDVEPVERFIQMDPPGRAELLDSELEIFSRDKVYDEALEMVGTFIRGVDPASKPQPDPRKLTTGEPMSAGAQRPRPHD